MSKVGLLVVLAMVLGCGAKNHPLDTGDGSVAGSGGTTGSGTGGSPGTGGTPGTGGSPGTGGAPGTGGTPGTGGSPGIPDGGLNGILDASLGGILDSGIIGGCPANPEGQMCAVGQGMPLACVPTVDAGPPVCFCTQNRWACLGGGGTPGGGTDGGGLNAQPCPATATTGTACSPAFSFCQSAGGMGGCICFPGQGGAATWRCM